jgi:hypothetical protein
MNGAALAVVDTNVGIAANLRAEVTRECALACIRTLRAISEGGHLLLDAEGRIFAEYIKHLSLAGQPGTGDVFVRWVADNRYNADLCTLVPLHETEDGSFTEFPADDALRDFDKSDRKFVAVAATYGEDAEVLVAVDRGWVRFEAALRAAAVVVRRLCPRDIKS